MKIIDFNRFNNKYSSFFYVEKALIVSIMYVSLLIPSAFAQGDQIEGFIEDGIGTMVNEFTEELDFSDPNMLNATEEETENLTDSGLEMIGSGIEMFKTSHHFAENLIQFLSPVYVDQFILFLVAGAIAVIIGLSLIKRMAMHLLIFVVLSLVVVALIIYFYY